MKQQKGQKRSYHHGNLAESLLDAVDELATRFGFEAVTLRGCAKLVGVSPSSAFRHYTDKRALLTAFATRALNQLSGAMQQAKQDAHLQNDNAFYVVGLSYIRFAIEKPAFFRAMWREEAIYSSDGQYTQAANQLSGHLQGGFADTIRDNDPGSLSSRELLAWSSVHGLANLMVDGPVGRLLTNQEKLEKAGEMIRTLGPALDG